MRVETAGKAQAYALDETLKRNRGAQKVFCMGKLSLIHPEAV
jgi:hypothetical protein